MAYLYVAGPVLRSDSAGEIADFLSATYRLVSDAAKQANMGASLPFSERSLEAALPQRFFEEIYGRINNADAVITVFAPFDPSGPVESAIAGLLKKRQLILAMRPSEVPRIMRGLPGVSGVVPAREPAAVSSAVFRFLKP
jgi:hypothetical protein